MKSTKQAVIEKTIELIERMNQDIADSINDEIDASEGRADFLTKCFITSMLNCETEKVRKYIRVKREESAVAFVCTETGDIFKPATYKGPAKHARGNVFSDQGGREAFSGIGQFGLVFVRYLR